MKFSIIGTGNIASFIGTRLVTARHKCMGVYSRDTEKAGAFAETLLCDKYGAITEVEDGSADVCFLAVSDAAISEVAAQLSFKQTILVHTAGAVTIDTIQNAAADCAILWPVYSILKNSLPAHRNIPCAWEASTDKAKRVILTLAHAITDELFEARYDQRRWLHLTAVMSNNFITHLMAICEQVCADNDLPFSTLLPIIEQTFDRIKNGSPHALQTGPAVRNDTTTIQSQIALLEQHPEWQNIYKAMTNSIQKDYTKD
ncbi:MAG: hypothetical protein JWQ38_422 [Flavipsychrobacter sp.]|nr:hypothetical protein [Flavipsychrobacter sp.]